VYGWEGAVGKKAERIQRNWGKKEGNGVWNGGGRTWEGYNPDREAKALGVVVVGQRGHIAALREAPIPAPNPVLPGPLGRLRRGVRGVTTRDSGVHLLRVRGSSGAGFDGEGWTNESQPESGPALPRSEGGRNRKGGGREEGRKGGREGEGDMVCWEGPWLVSGRMGEKKAQERRGDGRVT